MKLERKKTKIVATIGPATESEKQLKALITNGVNVIRLNFSHNTHEWHQKIHNRARRVSKSIGKEIAILQDLSGPKIRIGRLPEEGITLKKGQTFVLTTEQILGDTTRVSINYAKLPQEVKKGMIIKIEDGKKTLQVTKMTKKEIHTKVVDGGFLTSRKGVNIPGAHLSISSLTKKDKKDVLFGIKNKVDYIAFSFVQTKNDVLQLRRILNKHNSKAKIIVKIETAPAVEHFDEILEATDGVMIARGDLAIEVGVEKVPLIQKEIIKKCAAVGKPVITATQMLDSMEHSPVPTRAEVSDVANAIFDGTDALMLSGETSIGKHPIEAVKTMVRIAEQVEPVSDERYIFTDTKDVTDTISEAAVNISERLESDIIALTESGFTAQMISRFRPEKKLIALTPYKKVARQLILHYGVIPIAVKEIHHAPKNLRNVLKKILKNSKIKTTKLITVTKGNTFGKEGTTDTVSVVALQ